MSDILHEDTEYPVCPWCGHEHDGQDQDDIVVLQKVKCDECGHYFKTFEEPQTYSTSKVNSRGMRLRSNAKRKAIKK